jgi:hypothetical protein
MASDQQVKNGKITIATENFQGAIPETGKKIPISDKPKADEIKQSQNSRNGSCCMLNHHPLTRTPSIHGQRDHP